MFENRGNRMTMELAAPPYTPAVPLPARVVAALLRERLPGVGVKKLHKLLYYCQGHHLATFGRPLFHETVSAWDMGPVVGSLWFAEKQGPIPMDPPPASVGEAELNTVGYVLSRYGRLSGRDLAILSHAEDPWQRAGRSWRPGESVRIELEWMRDYFAAGDDDDEIAIDGEVVSQWLAGAQERAEGPAAPDDLQKLRARLERARLAGLGA
jgi:uncharacterized phage-associated protein